ncbi:glycosyltransferase family 2 protein [Empedobacter falsenii]
MKKKITAIIITYNPEVDLLIRQFNSLVNQVDQIIYVDNHSSIQFKEQLISDKIKFIFNNENFGLGKAQNQGINLAFKEGASHVILFDQDSIADQDLVKELINTEKQFVNNNIKVALIGPAIYNNYNNPPTIAKVVKTLGWSIIQEYLNKSVVEVAYCIASGSLISKEAFINVGDINEDLFIDALDLEWCLRAKSKGYKILQNPSAKIFHQLGNGSNDKILSHSTKREFYICRNNILLIKMKHIPLGYRIRKAVLTPLRPLKALMKFKLNYVFAGIKGILKGI